MIRKRAHASGVEGMWRQAYNTIYKITIVSLIIASLCCHYFDALRRGECQQKKWKIMYDMKFSFSWGSLSFINSDLVSGAKTMSSESKDYELWWRIFVCKIIMEKFATKKLILIKKLTFWYLKKKFLQFLTGNSNILNTDMFLTWHGRFP